MPRPLARKWITHQCRRNRSPMNYLTFGARKNLFRYPRQNLKNKDARIAANSGKTAIWYFSPTSFQTVSCSIRSINLAVTVLMFPDHLVPSAVFFFNIVLPHFVYTLTLPPLLTSSPPTNHIKNESKNLN